MEHTALATTGSSMLDKAEQDSKGAGTENIMNSIHNFKIYNPKIGDPVDKSKANKFRLIEANTGKEIFSDFGGEVTFNPLDVSYFISGSIFPLMENKEYAKDKVFFFTNEFGKFAKKTDTIGLAANNTVLGFFSKGEFEEMIKTPNLNGGENQFYEKKKDKEGRPYNGSLLRKGAVIYGQFVGGDYDKEFFRMFTSVQNIGVTFRDGEACEPDEGTFEYAVNKGLDDLNELLVSNGRKPVTRISADQCDITISIKENDKHNFLPVFKYNGLVMNRGGDNTEDQKFIYDLKNEHFKSIFGDMLTPTPILIGPEGATVTIAQPKLKAPVKEDTRTAEEVLTAENAIEIFETPGVEDHKKHEAKLDF